MAGLTIFWDQLESVCVRQSHVRKITNLKEKGRSGLDEARRGERHGILNRHLEYLKSWETDWSKAQVCGG
jgi:hypothetical protein